MVLLILSTVQSIFIVTSTFHLPILKFPPLDNYCSTKRTYSATTPNKAKQANSLQIDQEVLLLND